MTDGKPEIPKDIEHGFDHGRDRFIHLHGCEEQKVDIRFRRKFAPTITAGCHQREGGAGFFTRQGRGDFFKNRLDHVIHDERMSTDIKCAIIIFKKLGFDHLTRRLQSFFSLFCQGFLQKVRLFIFNAAEGLSDLVSKTMSMKPVRCVSRRVECQHPRLMFCGCAIHPSLHLSETLTDRSYLKRRAVSWCRAEDCR